mgnify:CR=1 FL=1
MTPARARRLPALLFPVITVLLIWRWGRSFAGPIGALLAAAIFAFDIDVRAVRALVDGDGHGHAHRLDDALNEAADVGCQSHVCCLVTDAFRRPRCDRPRRS